MVRYRQHVIGHANRTQLFIVAFAAMSFFGSSGSVARANPEPTANYDASVAGMGGIALPTLETAAALFHNPAQLDHIERYALTAVVTSLLVDLEAPFAGPGSESKSGTIYAPLIFAGGVARVHDRVTVGLGAYVTTGFGGGFRNVPCVGNGTCDFELTPPADQTVTLFIAELAVPISVRISDKLTLGVSVRLPWGRQDVNVHQELPSVRVGEANWGVADQRVSGFGIPGVLLGASYRPSRNWTLALTYRSKVWVNMSGSTLPAPIMIGDNEVQPLPLATDTQWVVPHMIRAGVAWRGFGGRLTIAAEFKVQMHAEANREQRFRLTPSPEEDAIIAAVTPNVTVADFSWKNVFNGAIGAQYFVTEIFPIRAGLSMANAASNANTLTPFSPQPGILFGVYAGIGVHVGSLLVDLAWSWGGGPGYTKTENGPLCIPYGDRTGREGRDRTLATTGGCAGTYDANSHSISLSATYRR